MADDHDSPQPSLDVDRDPAPPRRTAVLGGRRRDADRRCRRLPVHAPLRIARRAAGRAAERLGGRCPHGAKAAPRGACASSRSASSRTTTCRRSSPRTASTRSWRTCLPRRAAAFAQTHLDLSAEDPQILESLLGTTRPEGALAFSVSFTDSSPRVARDVANDLVALYLEENREVRREQAAETIRFLTQEARRLETEIAAREERLAEFKTAERRGVARSRRQQPADARSRRPRSRCRRAGDPHAARAASSFTPRSSRC